MLCPYCARNIPENTIICPVCHNIVSEAQIASSFRGHYQSPQHANSQPRVENTGIYTAPVKPSQVRRLPQYQQVPYGGQPGYGANPQYAQYAAYPGNAYPGQEQPLPAEPKKLRKWPFVLAAIVLVVILLVTFLVVPLAQEAIGSNRTDHRVTFLLKTPGYNDDATAIPVQVTGTKTDGTPYEQMVFLDGGGNGVSLDPGEYTLTFPGGSILANGTVLVAPADKELKVTVPENLARNEFVQVPTKKAISYKAVSAIDLTDETLDGVYEYAIQAPGDNGKATKLRDNAKKVHEEAVAQKEADMEAIEKEATGKLKVSLGDEAKFVGTLEINTAEEVAERLNDENIAWNLEGQKLAILWLDEPRKVTVETSTADEYDGYDLYFDEEDGMTYTNTEEYEVKCLVFNTDVEGVYSAGDDGTLSSHDGKHVLATGRVNIPSEWTSTLISPITLANPMITDL